MTTGQYIWTFLLCFGFVYFLSCAIRFVVRDDKGGAVNFVLNALLAAGFLWYILFL